MKAAVWLLLPLLAVALAISYHQLLVRPGLAESGLVLVGYNYNRQLVQLSVGLHNAGTSQLLVLDVYYDGERLRRGIIGSPLLLGTNRIILPEPGSWNMDSGSFTGAPAIAPGGFATLYLGVTSLAAGARHTLSILTDHGRFDFTLLAP